MIFSKLLPEYEYGNLFIEMLYDTKEFILLRKKYKDLYCKYPSALIERYKFQIKIEPVCSIEEIHYFNKEDLYNEIEIIKRNQDIITDTIGSLLKELEQIVRN